MTAKVSGESRVTVTFTLNRFGFLYNCKEEKGFLNLPKSVARSVRSDKEGEKKSALALAL